VHERVADIPLVLSLGVEVAFLLDCRLMCAFDSHTPDVHPFGVSGGDDIDVNRSGTVILGTLK